MKFIKRLFCKHKFMPYQSIQESIGQNRYRIRHIWKCTKCGKEEMH